MRSSAAMVKTLFSSVLQRAQSGEPPDLQPAKKRRGAKPKYICATEEEAIARRCIVT